MFKFSVQKSDGDIFKSKVSKEGGVTGYEKIANNMSGSKVNAKVNSHYQPKRSISICNINKK